MSEPKNVFDGIDMRVASYTPLTAEEGRQLYARWVKRGLEVEQLEADLAQARAEAARMREWIEAQNNICSGHTLLHECGPRRRVSGREGV